MKILITGGAGFIGSHFIRHMMRRPDVELLVNLDKLTYAGHLENLQEFNKNKRYRFVRGDIANVALVEKLVEGLDGIINFAAETHVDRSIQDAAPFLSTNVIGTQVLLAAALKLKVKRFLQISTDEVYGSIARGAADEKAILNPSSPYSASKASADHLAMSYHVTFGLPVLITRAANNYGPYQYPEKFLPLFITHALLDMPLPLYGDGMNVREWLHVDDHCSAIERVFRKGTPGQIYNIGTGKGHANLDVVKLILKRLNKPESLLRWVTDRPGHDRRYAMSISKIKKELGWSPQVDFKRGLPELIDWYLDQRPWWEAILQRSKTYRAYYKKQYAGRAS
jgi:dTDP-glucose 4,6-dehydratase